MDQQSKQEIVTRKIVIVSVNYYIVGQDTAGRLTKQNNNTEKNEGEIKH